MGDVLFPVKLADINKIEKLNNLLISVFQWCQDTEWAECVIPLRHGCGNGTPIDLLYIEDNDTVHYMLIKSFNGFMRLRTKFHHTMFYCRKCLHGFVNQEKQEKHSKLYNQGINQYAALPTSGDISFNSIWNRG